MLKITSKQLEVTALIRERIEGRLEKLSRHDIQLINPHIIITQEKQLFKIEASVGLPSGELFVGHICDERDTLLLVIFVRVGGTTYCC